MATELPLIVIVGPTASGKTGLAIELAKRYDGEIICADSRTVYKGMDIGTAKPTPEEQASVPHWGLDLVSPDERFTAADFKAYATDKIVEIRSRNHIPFLVGGTGLYVSGVIYDYQFDNTINHTLRKKLAELTTEELVEYCIKNNINLPENSKNKRHLIRAIEKNNSSVSRTDQPLSTSTIVGIATDNDTLRARINERAEHLFENHVVEEAIRLGKKYGWKCESMTGNIYGVVRQYVSGKLMHDEMKQRFKTLDWQLAKRQMTWFKRDKYIHWRSLPEAREFLVSILNEHKS